MIHLRIGDERPAHRWRLGQVSRRIIIPVAGGHSLAVDRQEPARPGAGLFPVDLVGT